MLQYHNVINLGKNNTEELMETYRIMDAGCHKGEYLDYLKSCDLI